MKLPLIARIFAIAFIALPIAPDPVAAQSETWTVELSSKQKRGLRKMRKNPGITAFAISPEGHWGYSYGRSTEDAAEKLAMQYCQANLKPGYRDCFVYEVNGRVIAPSVVKTTRVREVYRPLNGLVAPSYFGVAKVNFTGNRARALADYKAFEKNANHRSNLKPDPKLLRALTGRTYMLAKDAAFAIWFDKPWASQHSEKTNSRDDGIYKLDFPSWVATKDGLVCLFDGNGGRAGSRCLIIDYIKNGKGRHSWGNAPHVVNEGYVIAGDARRGSAR